MIRVLVGIALFSCFATGLIMLALMYYECADSADVLSFCSVRDLIN